VTLVLITPYLLTFYLAPSAAVNSQGAGTQFSGPQHDLHHDLGLTMFLLVLLEGLLWVFLSLPRTPFSDVSAHQSAVSSHTP
jgi:hypothetical protein